MQVRAIAIVLGLLVIACGTPASSSKAPPSSKAEAPPPAVPVLHAATPSVIDDATLARMIEGPTDWVSFVSPTRGFTSWQGDYIDRHCGKDAAGALAALLARMRGAKCESSTEQALCETSDPTHIVQFIREDGRWFGYGGTYGDPDELSDRERAVFDPSYPHATCEPKRKAVDWNSYTPTERARRELQKERAARSQPAAVPPAPEPIPAAARFDAAPNILRAKPTHGCTTKYVDGYLQIRCPIAGDGHGLFDIGRRQSGTYAVTSTTVTWTVRRDAMSAFAWWFDTGAFELASSATEASWVEAATYKPGAAAIFRAGMKCCILKHSAPACIGQGILEAVSTCKRHKADCAAMDACIMKAGKLTE